MAKRSDFYIVSIIGFLVGGLILFPVASLSLFEITPGNVIGSLLFFSILAPISLGILTLLSRFSPALYQFGKFAAVGALNTTIDIGILNLFVILTNISTGIPFGLFKAASFFIASINSYFWNKFWSFTSGLPVTPSEYIRFLIFTVAGAIINVSIASFLVNFISAPVGISVRMWGNLSAIFAVLVSLVWNFFSYKRFVFKI